MVRHGGLAIIPSVNFVQNIGFGGDATHTTAARHPLRHELGRGMAFPLDHPPHRVTNVRYERHLARYHAGSHRRRVQERARVIIAALRPASNRPSDGAEAG